MMSLGSNFTNNLLIKISTIENPFIFFLILFGNLLDLDLHIINILILFFFKNFDFNFLIMLIS